MSLKLVQNKLLKDIPDDQILMYIRSELGSSSSSIPSNFKTQKIDDLTINFTSKGNIESFDCKKIGNVKAKEIFEKTYNNLTIKKHNILY